jgi:replicative DNA helicase
MSGPNVAWLERWVTACTPAVLVIGPLYKLHREDINGETAARALTVELDSLRARHNVAIITEAHAGHAKGDDGKRLMRPRGSSLFLGWPEFGIGLRRSSDDPNGTADVVAWRGHRDDGRMWPDRLFKGRPGLIPWKPFPEYYDLVEGRE